MNTAKLHILIGIDFSDSSSVALSHAVKLAARTDARLHLCHIAVADGFVSDVNLGLNIPDEFPDAKEARVRMQRLLGLVHGQVDTEIHVRMNRSPLAGLLSVIQELKPDLVIVGSHGKGVLKSALLGSVSGQLAQRSPVPVLLVPAPGRELIADPPAPAPAPELPAVGRAVTAADTSSAGSGIASVGGGEVRFR